MCIFRKMQEYGIENTSVSTMKTQRYCICNRRCASSEKARHIPWQNVDTSLLQIAELCTVYSRGAPLKSQSCLLYITDLSFLKLPIFLSWKKGRINRITTSTPQRLTNGRFTNNILVVALIATRISIRKGMRRTWFTSIQISDGPCIRLEKVSNGIIHGLHINDCKPNNMGNVLLTESTAPILVQIQDEDAISVLSCRDIWIDHNTISKCADGLVDVTLASTTVTISNNRFSFHDKAS